MSWIEAEIVRRGGSVRFRDFMELALYHPEHGYYSSNRPRYGRTGDFLTAPTASPWYGRVFAGLVAPHVGGLRLVDVASGDGSFLACLRDELARLTDDAGVEFVSVERSDTMRAVQRDRLAAAGHAVIAAASVEEVARSQTPTVIHASEFYDALPVHRVVGREDGLRELWVRSGDDGLQWVERMAEPALQGYFEDRNVELEPGQYAEVNSDAEAKHGRLLDLAAGDGLAVVLDYGYPSGRLYDARGRSEGSLVAYREHALVSDLLRDPGRQDLTAHVNWDDLRRAADSRGWRELGLWPLAEFLIRAGLERVMDREGLGSEAELTAHTVTERQEIKRLLDPDGMGSDLKVLVQGRGELATVAERALSLPAARE
jgi:SAM-dependent MidA family methyltransferase